MIFGHCSWRFCTRSHGRMFTRGQAEKRKKWFLHIVEWECYFWPTFYCSSFSSVLFYHESSTCCVCMDISSNYSAIWMKTLEFPKSRHSLHRYCNSINIFMIISITYSKSIYWGIRVRKELNEIFFFGCGFFTLPCSNEDRNLQSLRRVDRLDLRLLTICIVIE